MKTRIFYFSATGNNLIVAKKLARFLPGEVEISPLTVLMDHPSIAISEKQVGFILPVYFADISQWFLDLISKVQLQPNSYLFTVVTCNGVPGMALYSLAQQLQQQGHRLSFAKTIDLPGNAMPTAKREVSARLAALDAKTKVLAAQIQSQVTDCQAVQHHWQTRIQKQIIGYLGSRQVVNPKKFWTTDACIGCGLCQQLCVLNNIGEKAGKPVWGTQCIRCLACFHWCPKQAIQIGGLLSNRSRYHHPEVRLQDIKGQSSNERRGCCKLENRV